MLPRATQIWICLFLVLQLTTARSFHVLKARDENSITPGQASPSNPGATPTHVPTPTPTPDQGSHGNNDKNDSKQSNAAAGSSATPSSHPSSTTSASTANQTNIFNGTYSTIPEGELPLKPTITPGWAVAGVIMIITGLIYTLIGIKNRFVHSFFSVAYIVALGIAVLIVYVMSVPVGNAAQGGYVVAAVLSGCALGAASTFFKELTEGLGCALGGFCISMWLLCLVPGGLLTAAAAKAIFIGAFALVGFAFFFSRWTREWAMIGLMSFSGATTIVLGVDCFSRSGLKEFWVYIWNLNDQLFPLGADTYPVTRGIRVEAALIVIICLIGIVSQIKLWRIVREKREKKAAERAEGQRDLEAEEENVGRQIQEQTERERAEWEKVYGDGAVTTPQTSHSSNAELVGDEKKLRSSLTNSTYTPSRNEGIDKDDSLEASTSQTHADALMSAEAATEGKLTVRVACDDAIIEDQEESIDEEATDKQTTKNADQGQKGSENGKRGAQRKTLSQPPAIVPLPFKVPENGDDAEVPSDGSSVAAFADEEEEEDVHPALRKANNRLTQMAAQSPTRDRRLDSRQSLDESDEGTRCAVEDHRSSLAATLDRSVSDKDSNSVISQDNTHEDAGITAETEKNEKHVSHEDRKLASVETKETETERSTVTVTTVEIENSDEGKVKDNGTVIERPTQLLLKETRPESTLKKAKATDDNDNKDVKMATESKEAGEPQKTQSIESKADNADETNSAPVENADVLSSGVTSGKDDNLPEKTVEEGSRKKSEDPVGEVEPDTQQQSGPVSLTKHHLPRSLSKVALSYRTNEWAKHLSLADAPEPDEIHIEPIVESTKARKEVARLVDVDDLQRTAEDDALPRATMHRSDSQLSRFPSGLKKEISTASLDMTSPRSPTFSPGVRSPTVPRRKSAGFETLAGEIGTLAPNLPIPEEDEENTGAMSPKTSGTYQRQTGLVSYASTQTLLGQREQWLRNKSQGNLVYQAAVPDQVDVFGTEKETDALHNYPMYAAALSSDPDEVPLSHRREMMRSTGNLSLAMQPANPQRSNNGVESSENSRFNSHQPKRTGTLSSPTAREVRLANFRQSVAQDLRTTVSAVPSSPTALQPSSQVIGVDAQRNFMINQMGAEAQRREMRRREQEQQDARFLNRMRSGDLIEAHREVMRRMQNSAKE